MNFWAIIHALLHVIKCNYKQLCRIAFVACFDSVHLQHIIQNQIKGCWKQIKLAKHNWPRTGEPLTLNLLECRATKALISRRRESLATNKKGVTKTISSSLLIPIFKLHSENKTVQSLVATPRPRVGRLCHRVKPSPSFGNVEPHYRRGRTMPFLKAQPVMCQLRSNHAVSTQAQPANVSTTHRRQ